MRIATELQIAHFGQCPMQLFWRPHVPKFSRGNAGRRLSLSEMLGVYELETLNKESNTNLKLSFQHAPISHWIHLLAPPPGPHAHLIAIRFSFPDRCMAVDGRGIFHFFMWTWKANTETSPTWQDSYDLFSDKGYFEASEELQHFRSVPRLHYSQSKPTRSSSAVAVISKCLFASQSFLVVSDGDGKGGLCFQLVDPSKCSVQGEVMVESVHSDKITAIHMDPIGSGKKFFATVMIITITAFNLSDEDHHNCE